MNIRKTIIILGFFLVAFIGGIFRFYKLSSYPVSLSMDEAAIGYNAYSILKTGKDEHGEKLPLAFTSVGDYKPPVDVYLTVPSVALFGLSEFSVRFPVALLSVLSVVVFILILRELKFSWFSATAGGFWLAISPWHVYFSRASFEAITALFFLLLGLLLILYWVRKKQGFSLVLSVISFSLSVWAYHSTRFFVPILVLSLIFLFRNRFISLLKNRRLLFLTICFTAIFAIPFIRLAIFTPAIRTRAAVTSILRESNLALNLHNGNYKNFGELIFNNDLYLVFHHWTGKYLNYFDFRFWFWKGLEFTPPGYLDMGLLYLVDLPIFLLGIYAIYISKNKILKNLSVFWFFCGPLAASFTMNEQHPLRALVWLPFFGFVWTNGIDFLKNHFRKLVFVYFFLILINIVYFYNIYFIQFPYFYSEYWQYGYKQNALFACENKTKYDKIFITDTFGSYGPESTGIPYIYVLFYCKYNPESYLGNNRQIDNIYTKRMDGENDINTKNLLFIASPWDLPLNLIPQKQIIKKIDFLNGRPAFYYVETGKQGGKIKFK